MVSFSRAGNNKSKRVTAIGTLPESKKQRLRSPATTLRSAESEEDLEFPMTVEDEDGDATFSPVKRQPKRTQTPSAKDEDEEEEEEERAGGGLLNGGERLVRLRAARWRDLNFRGIQLSAKDIRVHWEPKSSTTVTYKRSRNVNGGFVSLSNGEVDIGEIVPFEDSAIDSSSAQSASSSTSLDSSSACNTRLRIRCRGVMEATQGNVWRVHKESLLHIFHRSELIVTLRLSVRTSWRPLGALFFVVPPSSALLHPLPSIPLPITTMSISSPSPSPASSLSSSPLASPPFIASIADMKCVLPPPRSLARSTPNLLAPSDTATPGIPIVASASLPFLLQSDRHNLEVEGYWSFSTVTPASSSPEEEYASNPFEETSISLSASPTSELEFASFVEFQLKSNFIPTATTTALVAEEQRQGAAAAAVAVHHQHQQQQSVEPNALDYFGSLFPEASLPLNLSSS